MRGVSHCRAITVAGIVRSGCAGRRLRGAGMVSVGIETFDLDYVQVTMPALVIDRHIRSIQSEYYAVDSTGVNQADEWLVPITRCMESGDVRVRISP